MSKHILIVYATRAGSTVEVAQVIGEVLGGRGFEVQIKSVKENPAVDGYQAVIIGSAIRMGNWLPEVVDFLRKNQPKLSQIPTAIFTCHRLKTVRLNAESAVWPNSDFNGLFHGYTPIVSLILSPTCLRWTVHPFFRASMVALLTP